MLLHHRSSKWTITQSLNPNQLQSGTKTTKTMFWSGHAKGHDTVTSLRFWENWTKVLQTAVVSSLGLGDTTIMISIMIDV